MALQRITKAIMAALSVGTSQLEDGAVTAAKMSQKVAFISDVKAAGTDGGTFTSGAWLTRDLNTENYDADGIVSIASNQFTLAAGTYRITWSCPAFKCNGHKSRLYNVTDAAVVGVGTTEQSSANVNVNTQTRSYGSARVTIASSKAFEIQHQCSTTQSTNGLGAGNSFGAEEAYTWVEIVKE